MTSASETCSFQWKWKQEKKKKKKKAHAHIHRNQLTVYIRRENHS